MLYILFFIVAASMLITLGIHSELHEVITWNAFLTLLKERPHVWCTCVGCFSPHSAVEARCSAQSLSVVKLSFNSVLKFIS